MPHSLSIANANRSCALDRSFRATIGQSCNQCPVCRAASPLYFLHTQGRHYLRCQTCQARFLDPLQLPGPQEERAHYLLHENDPDDPGYRTFLSKFAGPFLQKLSPGSRGLDYGCGPGPALAAMLREAGHDTSDRTRVFKILFIYTSLGLLTNADLVWPGPARGANSYSLGYRV